MQSLHISRQGTAPLRAASWIFDGRETIWLSDRFSLHLSIPHIASRRSKFHFTYCLAHYCHGNFILDARKHSTRLIDERCYYSRDDWLRRAAATWFASQYLTLSVKFRQLSSSSHFPSSLLDFNMSGIATSIVERSGRFSPKNSPALLRYGMHIVTYYRQNARAATAVE